jgi:hypothetical protein
MQTSYGGTSTPGNLAGIGLDGILLIHFLNALERLQIYLGESSGEDEESRFFKVNLQFQYLLHLLPREKQKRINNLVDERYRELKESKEYKGEFTPMYIARMQIITGILEYLNTTLDLTHEDIVASLTPRARDHAISTGEVLEIA